MSHRFMLGATAAVVVTIVLAACEQPLAPSVARGPNTVGASFDKAGATKSNVFVPISGTLLNSCTGELVALSGREHIVMSSTPTATGTTLSAHLNFDDLQGVSDAGVEYHANATVHDVTREESSGAFTDSQLLNEELVSRGGGDNLILHVTQTFAFDGTNFTTTISRMSVECRG